MLEKFLLFSVLGIYLYETIRLLINYRKYGTFLIHEPEVFLMIPIFFIYVLNFACIYPNVDYLLIFTIGFFTFYITNKFTKLIMSDLISKKLNMYVDFPFRLNKIANNLLFLFGIFLFVIVFHKKGIPMFSPNPDIARAQLGMGYVLWPAFSFINFSIWLDYVYLCNLSGSKYIKFMLFFLLKLTIAIVFILLTGWRGQIIQLILGIVVIASIYNKLSLRYIIIFLAFIVLIAFVGILRAYLSGKALYGGAIKLSMFSGTEIIYLAILYLYYRFQEHFFNFLMTIDFTNTNGPLYFKGLFMDLSIILPGKGQGLDFFLRSHLPIKDWTGGGGLPPTLFGSFYVEYQTISVVLFSFVFGLLLASFYSIVRKLARKNVYLTIFYASSLVWAFKSIFGSIGQNFITYNLTMSFFMFVYVYLYLALKNMIRIRERK